MLTGQSQVKPKPDDDSYLKIWQIEQEHTRSRWTLTTFYLGISFAILGFSFQEKLAPLTSSAARISALLIYWLAYLMFIRFLLYNRMIRT